METTIVYQKSTGTPLAASSDDSKDAELIVAKKELKQVLHQLSGIGNIKAFKKMIHYQVDETSDLAVVTIISEGFPTQLSLSYLNEIHDEFVHVYGMEMVNILKRGDILKPYQFMSFETFITKTKKIYADTRAKDGLSDINGQLRDVKKIMNQNINDLLNRGEELNNLQDLSTSLREQSIKYQKYAKKINWDLMVKKYAPVLIVGILIILIFYRWLF